MPLRCCLLFYILIPVRTYGKQVNEKNNSIKPITEYLNIHEDKKFAEFTGYCGSAYSHIKQDSQYKLFKLIVIHRHGDRAPLQFADSKWGNATCKVCTCEDSLGLHRIPNCKNQKCREGDLSIGGYTQMNKLGEYIKNEYGKQLIIKPETTFSRATQIGRTHASLHGVYMQDYL